MHRNAFLALKKCKFIAYRQSEHETVGSSPATPTKIFIVQVVFFRLMNYLY